LGCPRAIFSAAHQGWSEGTQIMQGYEGLLFFVVHTGST
jgi:hypothetical protein